VPAAQLAAIVFAAAPLAPSARLRTRLGELDRPYVVAADRGAITALTFGYLPDVVVGDLDSIDATTVDELRKRGVPIEAHPRDKDATDGQLAIQRALRIRPARLVLVGFLGGPRLDQALANVLLLVGVDPPAVLLDEQNECVLVRPGAGHAWRPERNEVVSLLPWHGDAEHVLTQGLRWSLTGETLHFGDTRGVSNEAVADEASVSVKRGLLLVTRHFPSP